MHIGEICTRAVVTCRRGTSALELARLMRDRHVGDVVVVDDLDGVAVPVGIVTDRDLVVQVMARGGDPASLQAGELMAADLVTAVESEVVYDAIWHMRSQGVRRLPVVDARNRLLGVLTDVDVTRFLAAELTELARIAPRRGQRERAACDAPAAASKPA